MMVPSSRQLEPMAQRYGLRLIVLFGSQVSGRLHPESDVDVAVWSTGSLTSAQRLDLWRELSEAFEAEVDLGVLNHAEPIFLFQVARTGHRLYEQRRGEWTEFRAYAFRYYWDTEQLRDDLTRYIRRQTAGTRRAG